jgi:putative membrane protein
MTARSAIGLLAGTVLAVACSSNSTLPAAKAAPPSPLTDADVAAIVVTANTIDAEAGEIAAQRATSAEVREFAQTMVRDHRAVNEQAGQLVKKLGLTPTENAVSRQLQSDAKAVAADLAKRAGSDFNRAYMQREVAFHKAVIDAIDQALIPSTQNAELMQTLVAVRPAIVAHLEHAQRLAATLK